MPKPMPSWNRPSPSDLPLAAGSGPAAARAMASSVAPSAANTGGRLGIPVARLGSAVPTQSPMGTGQEVLISLARAPLGSRVFLESQSTAGPADRIQAFAVPSQAGREIREFRAVLPPLPAGSEQVYVPIAALNAEEVRGESFRRTSPAPGQRATRAVAAAEASPAGGPAEAALPLPVMTLLAHVDAELPSATLFGPTPEGVRIAFYIADGHWRGPLVHARYKAEGGDWLLVRKDGVAIPDVRATLETSDGALLYYELSGKIDLGPGGYERCLAGELGDAVTPFSAMARVSTSSEHWKWLNRLTLIGVGVVNLKIRRARYDLFSIQCDPRALTP